MTVVGLVVWWRYGSGQNGQTTETGHREWAVRMGNVKAGQVRSAREQARERLVAQAAEAAARQQRLTTSAEAVWAAMDARDAAEQTRQRAYDAAQATHDERLARDAAKHAARLTEQKTEADQAYDVEVGSGYTAAVTTAVRALLDDGHTVNDIAKLTGLALSEVRAARATEDTDTADAPADESTDEPAGDSSAEWPAESPAQSPAQSPAA